MATATVKWFSKVSCDAVSSARGPQAVNTQPV